MKMRISSSSIKHQLFYSFRTFIIVLDLFQRIYIINNSLYVCPLLKLKWKELFNIFINNSESKIRITNIAKQILISADKGLNIVKFWLYLLPSSLSIFSKFLIQKQLNQPHKDISKQSINIINYGLFLIIPSQ